MSEQIVIEIGERVREEDEERRPKRTWSFRNWNCDWTKLLHREVFFFFLGWFS